MSLFLYISNYVIDGMVFSINNIFYIKVVILMIEFKDITKIYKKTGKVALNKVTFDIAENEVVCLLGPNGAGKTTLTKCLAGLIIFDNGSITIDELEIKNGNNPYKNETELILDGARNIYWRAKVISNFYYFGALKGKSRKIINENIDKYDEMFKIKDLLNKRVCDLSLGQKQKVSILTSILIEPKILILDEPSNGLDIEAKSDLVSLLNLIKENLGTYVLLTSHDLEFTKDVSDRYILINNGEIQDNIINKDLSLDEIRNRYLGVVRKVV